MTVKHFAKRQKKPTCKHWLSNNFKRPQFPFASAVFSHDPICFQPSGVLKR